MSRSYIQTVEFEEDPKYCYHCQTWNHGPFFCKVLEQKKNKELEVIHANLLETANKEKAPPREWVPTGKNNGSGGYTEPKGGNVPSSSNTAKVLDVPHVAGVGVLTKIPGKQTHDGAVMGNTKKKGNDANLVGRKHDALKGGKGPGPPH
ncbi:unnamed protein product [Cuscuta campestris]|uniref:Uncharacterized protein n=1 Tax=Cuscuta campestris TaxID=132261 RepID=A0A484L0T4_9ASTE|nr:unnamed protein product [Cuscuta campestris]